MVDLISKYRIKANGKGKQSKELAIVPISLSNPNHYNEMFEVILNWVTKEYNEIIINLADTLYRHNYLSPGISEEKAYNIALTKGDKWIENHSYLLKKYKITRLNRWDKWISHDNFKRNKLEIDALYNKDEIFRQAIDNEINIYLKRASRVNKFDEFSKEQSKRFLLEESAVYPIIAQKYDADRIYPGTVSKWLKYLQRTNTYLNIKSIRLIRLYIFEKKLELSTY